MAKIYDDLTPAQLTALFAGKAPLVHLHGVSDVTGLDTVLAGYDTRISGIEGSYGEGQISRPAVNIDDEYQRYIWTTTQASPDAASGTLPSWYCHVTNLPGDSDGNGLQIAANYSWPNRYYVRRRSDSPSAPAGAHNWQPWVQLWHTDNLDPYNLAGEVHLSRGAGETVANHMKFSRGLGYATYLSTEGNAAGDVERIGFHGIGGWDFYVDKDGNLAARGDMALTKTDASLKVGNTRGTVSVGVNAIIDDGTNMILDAVRPLLVNNDAKIATEVGVDNKFSLQRGFTEVAALEGVFDGFNLNAYQVARFSTGGVTALTIDVNQNAKFVADVAVDGKITAGKRITVRSVNDLWFDISRDGSAFGNYGMFRKVDGTSVLGYVGGGGGAALSENSTVDDLVLRAESDLYLAAGGNNATLRLHADQTATFASNVFISGGLAVSGIVRNLSQVTVTGSTTIAARVAHTVVHRAASTPITITLPPGSLGARYTVTEADGFGGVTLAGTGGEQIRGLDNFPMNPWASTTVEWHAASGQWLVI